MRITQNNPNLVSEVRQWGCYFLSLHYYVSVFKKLQFSVLDINRNYHNFVKSGCMRSNCYILNPCAVLRRFDISASVRWEGPAYRCLDGEFEISEVKIKNTPGYHFIATNLSSVLYDSLSLKERGREYNVTSKRVFRKI
ncbi:DUF261 domain-containing protein [Borrelia puertoricensis]|uniref:DUF261 domain-containing protein n=1 Tax=Borrelia puertoricensis TaxID=2756107 RepID=UPI001FF2C00C|nr:DUF261 domain-containing protein [Borrelia puertoricensis]UPA18528.1 DUF261 domain-containing protein [Borrelia puertoricensis]UPA18791.1 DUF261 domain-containing protein [Borrelia puertoricensis]